MEQINIEIGALEKLQIFGGSGRISRIITNAGHNKLVDLFEDIKKELDTGEYESFEMLTLHKEKGSSGTPAGTLQLLINYLGWMTEVLDEACTQARSRKEGVASNLPSCQCEDSHIHPCICDDDSTPSKAMGIES